MTTAETIKEFAAYMLEVHESTDSADVIAVGRGRYADAVPMLARAVAALLPYVQHKDACEAHFAGMERTVTCDCGLDLAIGVAGAGMDLEPEE